MNGTDRTYTQNALVKASALNQRCNCYHAARENPAKGGEEMFSCHAVGSLFYKDGTKPAGSRGHALG